MQERYLGLFSTPDLLPWQLDIPQARLLLANVDEESYRASVFLDQRLNRDGKLKAVWVPVDQVLSDFAASTQPPREACFVFHIGHCGSTLLSNLLTHGKSLLPVREPLCFRALADARRQLGQRQSFLTGTRWSDIHGLVLHLLSRSYSPGQRALIKPSSICSPLVEPALRTHPRHRAILLYTDIDTYLAGVLRPQSRDALYNFAQERIVDLLRIAGEHTPYLHELSPAKLGALNWCASMAEFALVTADDDLRRRTLLVDFEEFLRARGEMLQKMLSFFDVPSTVDEANGLLSSTDYIRTYAKDASISYTPELRANDLSESFAAHSREIALAKRWLADFLGKVPSLAPLVSKLEGHLLGG